MAKKASKEDQKEDQKDEIIKDESVENEENAEAKIISDELEHEDNKELKELKSEYEALNNKFLRLQADFFNYKNRTEKERLATYGNAISDVLTDLLPVIDNFERAIEAENSENQEVKNFKNGVNMIYGQLFNTLQKKGLKEIEALDAKFDPNIHSGISFEVTDEKEEDTVIEVFQKGYTVNDRVIRPSMVKIAKK